MFPYPLFNYAPSFEYPLSGDIRQNIEPQFGDDIVGVPEIEREVVTRVASYGDQLGTLTDAVLALAKVLKVKTADVPELAEVEHLAAEVKLAKERVKDTLTARAEIALKRLKDVDDDGYARLVGK